MSILSSGRPTEQPAAETTRTSVTRLTSPFVGELTLPDDLLAAYNLAAHAVTHARQVVFTCQLFTGSTEELDEFEGYARLITDSVQEIWAEYPCHIALANVAQELAAAADSGSHFGGTSAHEAAVSFADRVLDAVWWVADPLQHSHFRGHRPVQMDVTRIPVRLRSIARQLAKTRWPDGDTLVFACQNEARVAATRRDPHAYTARSKHGAGDESTIWFHGARCYSVDQIEIRTVTAEEDDVLQAFLWNKFELGLPELERVCGKNDYPRIITALRTRYGGLFAKVIQLPTAPGGSCYTVRVRRVPRAR